MQTGDRAPDFKLIDHDGNERGLADYRGRRLVLYFYPRAFTPGCTTQACDFRDSYEAFRQAGYEIVGISPDPPDRLASFRAEHDLPFPMLSDPDHEVAERFDAWGTKMNYGREVQGLIRSTIVLDEAGNVSEAWHNVRAKGHVGRIAAKLT